MVNGTTTELSDLLGERILVLDGAMGTMIQQKDLAPEDFGGPQLEGCNEHLVLTRPDVILDIHRRYLAAGADIIETNTFGGTPLVLSEYGLQDKVSLINKTAAEIARKAAAEFSSPEKPRFVAGSIGPTTKAISVTGGITFRELAEHFHRQARALLEGGVDLLLVETCQDTRNVKAALIGIQKAFREVALTRPLIVSGTIEASGTMLAGQTAEALVVSLMHLNLLAVGLNCATGPAQMTDPLRTLHELSPWGVSCYPNAGLPDPEGRYSETPETLADQLERFVEAGWLNLVGGCCGTTEKHIAAIARMVIGKKPRQIPPLPPLTKGGGGDFRHRTFFSGIEMIESTPDNRPLIVGERTNVIGSRLFKQLILEGKWDEATEIARRQVKNGAQIIDVCLQSTDVEELSAIDPFYERLTRKVKTPIMIDTTDPKATEQALTWCQGRSIINSINLEEGEKKFEGICPLARRYGAALVVGLIDEDPVQAQAFTRERKLAVARRSHSLLTTKYGIREEEIIFDPLVFPCATGDENYLGGAVETIEGIRAIKEAFPNCRTIVGISNVSFGLPPSAREVVNSVFLYHATKAGLDLAIVNAEKLERFASIPEEERRLAEDLLFDNKQANIAAITEFYRGRGETGGSKTPPDLPLDMHLTRQIIEGTREGLADLLDRKRKEGTPPLEIINGPLMAGMKEVGRLFNKNELIVAEVLQSAEAMKAAVDHLKPFLKKEEKIAGGKVVLATVKGDVHDIGKNLVEIIFSNNGYEVINLGIKVPPEELIRACREHRPDLIGLSGLLVKSAQQMAITAGDLKAAGIKIPLLVGGAALSARFTETKIAPHYDGTVLYAGDAMSGLALANQLTDTKSDGGRVLSLPLVPPDPQRLVSPEITIPSAPYLDRKIQDVSLSEVWNHLNPQMLYGRHLGYKGNFEKGLASGEPKALELKRAVDEVKREALAFMKVRAVWQFFEASPEKNSIHLFAPGRSSPLHTFHFPREQKENGLCLADYVIPPRDSLAIFVVGAGEKIREVSEEWKHLGEYLKSHILQALALETAEAAAEWLHRKIREDWGFKDRLAARYRGKRYSFGYPACPNLEDQAGIWKLLRPEEIGILLTSGMMMEPEASVSAIVFHHPDCTYFKV